MLRPCLACLLLIALLAVHAPPSVQAAEDAAPPAWTLDPGARAISQLKLPPGASWVPGPGDRRALRLSVPAERAAKLNALRIPLDLAPWRGCQVEIAAQVRGEEVSRPPATHLGPKILLTWTSAIGGKRYASPVVESGSFPWRPVHATTTIDADAAEGELYLGLQGSSGTVEIADVTIAILRRPPTRPAAVWDAAAARTARAVPMRGILSPHAYRPDAFATLARWNVNLVRWQISRNWTKANTDRDLAEYDAWLEGKLSELDRALADAAGKGIKLVIDLHQPPGGRYPNRSMAMFFEEPYQRHFVAVWERIAHRYKGHPGVWAYDLINEPVQDRPSPPGLKNWYGLQEEAARAVRAIDPDTPICIAVDAGDSPQPFVWLTPMDLPNLIYQVHMYQPEEYTHQGVASTKGKDIAAGSLAYPGTFAGRPFDRAYLEAALKPVREFQLAYGVRIYAGEFSAIRWAPGADRYLADCIDLFEDYGWDWTYCSFRAWEGWSLEHQDLPASMTEHVLAPADQPTARAKVLFGWFERNQRLPAPAPSAAP